MKTSCKVLNLKVHVYKVIVSQKKESTLNHLNESFLKESQAVSCWRQHESLAYYRPLVGLFALVWMKMQIHSLPLGGAFAAVKIAVSPVTLYTQQHCAHKHCFIRHYRRDEMKMRPINQSAQISVTQRRGLEKWIVERVWELLSK